MAITEAGSCASWGRARLSPILIQSVPRLTSKELISWFVWPSPSARPEHIQSLTHGLSTEKEFRLASDRQKSP